MSIFPRRVGKNDVVTLHMKVRNQKREATDGEVVFVILAPNGEEIDRIVRKVTIPSRGNTEVKEKYRIKNSLKLGIYRVDGRFRWKDGEVRSETFKKDLFEVIEK